jgi:hydroxymethylbilane synthase
MTATLRLGSRRSPVAVAQSRQAAGMITERTGRQVEIVGVTTPGDVSRAELTQIGGTGVFVSALRGALISGEVDQAVHSLKGLPASPVAGIVLAAVPPRDDPRDALVVRDGASSPTCRPGPGSGPAHHAGPRSCSGSAPTCAACRRPGVSVG